MVLRAILAIRPRLWSVHIQSLNHTRQKMGIPLRPNFQNSLSNMAMPSGACSTKSCSVTAPFSVIRFLLRVDESSVSWWRRQLLQFRSRCKPPKRGA